MLTVEEQADFYAVHASMSVAAGCDVCGGQGMALWHLTEAPEYVLWECLSRDCGAVIIEDDVFGRVFGEMFR